jgi:hypothetical protein
MERAIGVKQSSAASQLGSSRASHLDFFATSLAVGTDIIIDRALPMVARPVPSSNGALRKPVTSSARKGHHRRYAQRKPCERQIFQTTSNNM